MDWNSVLYLKFEHERTSARAPRAIFLLKYRISSRAAFSTLVAVQATAQRCWPRRLDRTASRASSARPRRSVRASATLCQEAKWWGADEPGFRAKLEFSHSFARISQPP
jgi:hypothetical protein